MFDALVAIFESANNAFLASEAKQITLGVSERSLCGSLKPFMMQSLTGTQFSKYIVDVEYNRNQGGRLKTIVSGKLKPLTVTCDLIVHSRGEIPSQDNLIAIEMKKSTHPKAEKRKDKTRLECLTKDSFDDVWSFDGKTLPEHVCRYVLGVYYEIHISKRRIDLEYYAKGNRVSSSKCHF